MNANWKSQHWLHSNFDFKSMEVWEEAYRNLLFIRPGTQHATCSLCIRYKLVLRRLKRNVPARACQMAIFRRHLQKQYEDRIKYWQARSESKLGEKTRWQPPPGSDDRFYRPQQVRSTAFTQHELQSLWSVHSAMFGGNHGHLSWSLRFGICLRTPFIARFVVDCRAHRDHPERTCKRVFIHWLSLGTFKSARGQQHERAQEQQRSSYVISDSQFQKTQICISQYAHVWA